MNNVPNEYKQWLIDLKKKIRQSQIKAAVKVNTELLLLYWDLGRDITIRQMEAAWGSRFFEQLSEDLRKEFPDMKGFSVVNLTYCKRFYQFYAQDNSIRQQLVDEIHHQLGEELQNIDKADNTIRPQVVDEILPQVKDELKIVGNNNTIIRQQLADELQTAENKNNIILQQVVEEFENNPLFQIPWGHHLQIFTKCKTVNEALFYVKKTIKNGWSRAVLMNFIEADLYNSQGKAITNFDRLLPEVQYSLEIINQPIGVSEYKLSKLLPEHFKSALPSIEEIEKRLKNE